MSNSQDEKRVGQRHDYEEKIYFDFIYDFQTKIDFEPVEEDESQDHLKYHGLSRNVSAKGLCFRSDKQLNRGDILNIIVYIKGKEPVHFKGEVRWNKLGLVDNEGKQFFDTGIQLTTIEGKDVLDSIHYDDEYNVHWSEVLESVLGSYREAKQEEKNA